MSNRREKLHNEFEKSFGYRIPGSKKVIIKEESKNSLVLSILFIPFVIFYKIVQFCILGPKDFRIASIPYLVLSGLFMLLSSVIALFFMKEVVTFTNSFEFISSWSTPANALMVIFFLVQVYRGSNFISVASPSSSSSSDSKYDEIDKFKGYVNGRMTSMTNSAKEKYVKELFGGGK
jgi:hypothetical protein